jgi:hypothetical protein
VSIDRLYSLRELSAASGLSLDALYDSVSSGELEVFRRTARGKIYVRESVFVAWQASHSTAAKPQPVVVQLNPPHKAPASKREPVNIDDLLPPGHKRVFARSA